MHFLRNMLVIYVVFSVFSLSESRAKWRNVGYNGTRVGSYRCARAAAVSAAGHRATFHPARALTAI